MKETQQQHKAPTEQVSQVQQKKQLKYKGRYILKDGHRCWECDLISGEIREAEYESINIDISKKVVRTIIEKPNCIYLPKLNKKNAKRTIDNMFSKLRAKWQKENNQPKKQ